MSETIKLEISRAEANILLGVLARFEANGCKTQEEWELFTALSGNLIGQIFVEKKRQDKEMGKNVSN